MISKELLKEIELLSLFYTNEELKISEISKKLSISTNNAKKLIDSISNKLGFNIIYNKKKRTYCLLQNEIEKNHIDVDFWASLLMYIFYLISKSEDIKIKNLAVILLWNFFNFYKTFEKDEKYKFFDFDFLFLLNNSLLFYVKELDYNIFIKLKNAINNRNEIRITVVDRINSGFKRINLFPLHLAFLRNNWYLVGFCENEYIVMDVEDIKEIFFTGRILEEDIGFSVEDAIPEIREYIIPNKKYKILLDITEYIKVYGISFLHPSQKIIKDGDKILLQIEIVNLSILFRWLASFGKVIKIIEPEVVKQKYVEYLLSIVDQYN